MEYKIEDEVPLPGKRSRENVLRIIGSTAQPELKPGERICSQCGEVVPPERTYHCPVCKKEVVGGLFHTSDMPQEDLRACPDCCEKNNWYVSWDQWQIYNQNRESLHDGQYGNSTFSNEQIREHAEKTLRLMQSKKYYQAKEQKEKSNGSSSFDDIPPVVVTKARAEEAREYIESTTKVDLEKVRTQAIKAVNGRVRTPRVIDPPGVHKALYKGKTYEIQIIHRNELPVYIYNGQEFTSPSYAAEAVTGHPMSGRIFWGLKSGPKRR